MFKKWILLALLAAFITFFWTSFYVGVKFYFAKEYLASISSFVFTASLKYCLENIVNKLLDALKTQTT